VYKTDDKGKVLAKQPKGYPHTVPSGYEKAKDEYVRTHRGIDISSRDANGKPAPLEFKAGVYGTVVGPIGGQYGTITVLLSNGKKVQFLHTSKQNVEIGDPVTPDTILGTTGSKGANSIHLHIQGRDEKGKPIDPDPLLKAGRVNPIFLKPELLMVP
jgi:murein DD-endopeptidase MepM/ murein hydrolase activator NlpD